MRSADAERTLKRKEKLDEKMCSSLICRKFALYLEFTQERKGKDCEKLVEGKFLASTSNHPSELYKQTNFLSNIVQLLKTKIKLETWHFWIKMFLRFS